MAIVLAYAKLPDLLDTELTYLNGLDMRLFVNNYVPAGNMTAGDFTECSDPGYSPVSGVGFAASFLNGSNQAETDAPTHVWTFTHPGADFTVYGVYFTDPFDADAPVFAARALAPFLINAAGLTFAVTPRKVMTTL